jgi:hypothetical protein
MGQQRIRQRPKSCAGWRSIATIMRVNDVGCSGSWKPEYITTNLGCYDEYLSQVWNHQNYPCRHHMLLWQSLKVEVSTACLFVSDSNGSLSLWESSEILDEGLLCPLRYHRTHIAWYQSKFPTFHGRASSFLNLKENDSLRHVSTGIHI